MLGLHSQEWYLDNPNLSNEIRLEQVSTWAFVSHCDSLNSIMFGKLYHLEAKDCGNLPLSLTII